MLKNDSIRGGTAAGLVTLAVSGVTAMAATGAESKAPVVSVIPFTGQMGTDIHPEIYKEIVEDVNEVKPDMVVFRLDSADVDKNFHIQNDDRREGGLWQDIEVYRDLMLDIKNGLDVPEDKQIMWIEDAVGASTLLAMSWPTVYMTEGARLWGFDAVQRFADGWSDPDVRAKMYAAWVGIATGFPQAGGHPIALSQAMIEPQHKLGVKFDGRNTIWSNDLAGTVWTIDGSDKAVAMFDSDSAENVMLSKGTVQDLDDLMFLLGYREFERVDGGVELHEQYVEDWRRTYDRCNEWLKDIRDRGGNTVQDLGAQRGLWENILGGMRRYPAVEARLKREVGLDAFKVETEIETIKEGIRRARQNGRNGGGRGGSRGGNGGGGLGG
jgi:hypothetical protein